MMRWEVDRVDGDGPGVCSLCGRPAAGADDAVPGASPESVAPPTWTTESDPVRGPVLLCPDCTREHLRSIEARLDQEWW